MVSAARKGPEWRQLEVGRGNSPSMRAVPEVLVFLRFIRLILGGKTLVGTNRVVVRDPRHIRMRTMDPIKALDRERHQSRDGPPSPEPPGWVLRNYKEVQQSIVFEF